MHKVSIQGRVRDLDVQRTRRLLAEARINAPASMQAVLENAGISVAVRVGYGATEAGRAALSLVDLVTERSELTQAGQARVVAARIDAGQVGP